MLSAKPDQSSLLTALSQKPSDTLTMVAIADRLEEAAHTLRRLPKVTVQGFKKLWPPTVNEFHEAYGYNDAEVRLGPPSARHLDWRNAIHTILRGLEARKVSLSKS